VRFTTADLCDAFGPAVQSAQPVFRDYGGTSRFAGPIETLRVFEDNALVREALGPPGQGRVLVVDGGGSLRTALVGSQLAELAQTNKWAGLIVNGCIRDSAETRRIPVGIKALSTSPRRSGKAGSGERGVPVTFAGLTFSPGQFVYADEDGVILAGQDLSR
jgi:regulator of ribonuclease activity A